jgi:glycosyltransferase involved in cell wall biosynthesis
MIKIGFWSNQLCERGTEIALFDYAYYNQIILKNKSYIFYEKNNTNNNESVINKFKKEFDIVVGVNNFDEVDKYLTENDIHILYYSKGGDNDNKLSKVANNVIHCVFNCSEPHGDVYSALSSSVSDYNDTIPILPYIAYLPYHEENMRKELNIPEDAVVFGRHGGKGQFDIKIVQEIICNIAKSNPTIYFIFLNTNTFCETLPNIIHLDTIIDPNLKRKFINTCDAMIWARSDGETFGLAIAEFSICNKPVIAANVGFDCHYKILKNKGLWYSSSDELINQIKYIATTDKKELQRKDWNAYKEYTPENVMKIFYKIVIMPFIEKLLIKN